MRSYSRKVHCVKCGDVFPESETELLAVGKTVLRLCLADYKPAKQSADSALFAAQEKATAIVSEAKENIKKKGKER